MSNFTGGKLRLKGGEAIKPAGGVKKKKKSSSALVESAPGESPKGEAQPVKAKDGYFLDPNEMPADRRTEAEKKHEARMSKLEEEQLKKVAEKSHRDRVKDFNEKLAQLSEHHDIPKVGPG